MSIPAGVLRVLKHITSIRYNEKYRILGGSAEGTRFEWLREQVVFASSFSVFSIWTWNSI